MAIANTNGVAGSPQSMRINETQTAQSTDSAPVRNRSTLLNMAHALAPKVSHHFKAIGLDALKAAVKALPNPLSLPQHSQKADAVTQGVAQPSKAIATESNPNGASTSSAAQRAEEPDDIELMFQKMQETQKENEKKQQRLTRQQETLMSVNVMRKVKVPFFTPNLATIAEEKPHASPQSSEHSLPVQSKQKRQTDYFEKLKQKAHKGLASIKKIPMKLNASVAAITFAISHLKVHVMPKQDSVSNSTVSNQTRATTATTATTAPSIPPTVERRSEPAETTNARLNDTDYPMNDPSVIKLPGLPEVSIEELPKNALIRLMQQETEQYAFEQINKMEVEQMAKLKPIKTS